MYRGTPTQVADWRGSEWDAFVDTQPIFAYSGYRAGFGHDSLRSCDAGHLHRQDYHTHESPSFPHADSFALVAKRGKLQMG
jgi:hypothetical protein